MVRTNSTKTLKCLVAEDYFRINQAGQMLVVTVWTTEKRPSINFHEIARVFEAMKTALLDNDMTSAEWSVLYDLSKLQELDLFALPQFGSFALWAVAHRRRRVAFVFPKVAGAEVSLVRRSMNSFFANMGKVVNEYHDADSVDDALAWLSRK